VLQLAGTNTLGDFRRTLRIPTSVVTHTGPRTPGDPVQSFPTDLFSLQGAIFGDPDFGQLTITAGTSNGLPSPGWTILEDQGDGTFSVDSFFDIEYQIEFVGAPGGALEGLGGTTQGRVRVVARTGKNDSVEQDNGLGTATFPPEGGEYVGEDETFLLLDGLPPVTTVELDPSIWSFFCQTTPCSVPGAGLGGGTELFQATLEFELRGTGSLTGFRRNLQVPATVRTDSGPGSPGSPVQEFDTEMVSLLGSLPPGDPDFDELTITAGAANGLPSPGNTTLIDLGDGSFVVDSFFDIDYRIDFVGAPGGQFDGLSGSTTGEVRVTAGDRAGAPAHNITIVKEADPEGPTDFSFTGLSSFSLDDDADGTLPGWRTFNNLFPGTHTVSELPTSGWGLLDLVCSDPDSGTTVELTLAQAAIDLDLGEAITCIFTNAQFCGSVVVSNTTFDTTETVQACAELTVGPNVTVMPPGDVGFFAGHRVSFLNDTGAQSNTHLTAGVCGHDLCATGPPLDSACMPCVSDICAIDPFCCGADTAPPIPPAWDSQCVAEVRTVCGLLCR
jgi:hypothetical protein